MGLIKIPYHKKIAFLVEIKFSYLYVYFLNFHPTFLYEALWTTLLAVLLIKFGKKWRDGSIFYLYIAGYSAARFFIEGVRIDSAQDVLGLRLNQWTSIFIFILGVALFYRNQGKKKA